MGLISAVKRWWGSIFNKSTITEVFKAEIATSTLMLSKQELYRQIMRGAAPWNDADAPSLMLASVVVNETADEVLNDFKTEIIDPLNKDTPNARADFLNQQYEKYIDSGIEETVTGFLSEGETILKPYMTAQGVDVTVCATDSYAPLAYNSRGWLIDVAFCATTTKQNDAKTIYKLFERHTWDEEQQSHNIEYRAYKSVNSAFGTVGSESIGAPIPLSEVPEWAHLQDMTIYNMQQPLFVHIRNKAKFKLESPQLQGLPIFAKAVESGALRKMDQQEARTDWEFEGGELAVHASIDLFRPSGTKKGETRPALEIPKGKARLYKAVNVGPEDFKMDTFSPDLRIEAHGARLNQLRRDIELQTGMSYGIISDNNQLDRTAEEFRSSKKRLINTVMQTQKITGVAIDALIYSWDRLLDINASINVPAGEYEVVKQWNESLAADRPREFDERKQAQGMGWIEQYKNYAWFQDLDEETAKTAVGEMKAEQAQNEFGM